LPETSKGKRILKDRFANRTPSILIAGLFFCLAIGELHAADKVVLVAGGSGNEGGPATDAQLIGPFGVDFDRSGSAFLVEIAGHRVLKVDRQGVLTRVAGTGMKGDIGDGGPALRAEFNGMHSLAVSPSGDIFVADTWNNRVRKIDVRSGTITPLAGTGKKGYAGDGGPATRAEFGGIYCVALNPKREQLVLTDLDNRRIRVVDLATGIVTTVAGNGDKGIPVDDSEARTAPLLDPRAAVSDSQGNLWILERGGNALRVVNQDGKIRTVLGDGKGDVKLNGPKHLCIDRDGNVIIADTENHRILKYVPRESKTVIVAGTGEKGTAGVGGPPDHLQLNQPHGVTIGPAGELYIVDSSNNRVLRIEPSETAKSERWESAIQAFEEKDKASPPPQGEVLFVGSSTIRLWNLSESFPDLKCTNRGFGGSQMTDLVHYADRIIVPYRPRLVVVYSGDNDMASGKSPDQVLADVKSLVAAVHARLPPTRFVFISIKPSIQRWQLYETQRDTNRLIAEFTKQDQRLGFFDITASMLGPDGSPRPELFAKDGLHLSPAGYKIWAAQLEAVLRLD
jgi:DNA-binding beta-propeller fold protein YncE/lysophospholipase L1-like esterase